MIKSAPLSIARRAKSRCLWEGKLVYSAPQWKETMTISACSFKQGGKLYADKAKVVLQKSDLSNSFCVGVKDVSTSKFLWNLNGQTSKGNCLDLLSYNLSSSSNSTPIEINVFVDDSNQSASCSLLIEGIKQ